MSATDALNFANYELTTTWDNSKRIQEKRRTRFVEALEAQKRRITDVDATMLKGKSNVKVKKAWAETEKGVFFCPMVGRKPILLDGRHNSVRAETPAKLSKIIDLIIAETGKGSYDAALEVALARVARDASAAPAAPKTARKTAAKGTKKK